MKKAALLLSLLLLALVFSCKKDNDEATTANLVVNTSIAGTAGNKAGVSVKIYNQSAGSTIVHDALTGGSGKVEVSELVPGQYKIDARWIDSLGSTNQNYRADTIIQLIAGSNQVLYLILTVSNNNTDTCNIQCVNGNVEESNGNCVCVCATGYEGANCSTLSRQKLIGTFTATETCTGFTVLPYQLTITAGTNMDAIDFHNFGNFNYTDPNATVSATVNGNTITIPSQVVDADFTFQGSGSITGTTVTISYTVEYSGSTDSCVLTFTL